MFYTYLTSGKGITLYRYIKSETDIYKKKLDRVRTEYEDIKSEVMPIRKQIVEEFIDNIKDILDTLGMRKYFDFRYKIDQVSDFIEIVYTEEAKINSFRYATMSLNYQDFVGQHGKDEFYIRPDFDYSYYSSYKEPGVSVDDLKELQSAIKNMIEDFEVYVRKSYPTIDKLSTEMYTKFKEIDQVQHEVRDVEKGKEINKADNKQRQSRRRKVSNKKYRYNLVYQDAPSYDPMVEKQHTEFNEENDVAAVLHAHDIAHICSVEEALDYALTKGRLSEDEYDELYEDLDLAISVLSTLLTMDEVLDMDPWDDDEGNIIELKNKSTGKVLIKGTFMGPNGEDEDEYYRDEDW